MSVPMSWMSLEAKLIAIAIPDRMKKIELSLWFFIL
jgi:hypothetical protein